MTAQELNDGFSLDGAEGLDYVTMGAESIEELGVATVRVLPKDAPHQEFDSVLVCEIAGEASVMAKEAIEAEGEAHLIPTRICPLDEVEAIVVPLDDGRLEAADAERIGVNADGE
jgi:hypothetical protein